MASVGNSGVPADAVAWRAGASKRIAGWWTCYHRNFVHCRSLTMTMHEVGLLEVLNCGKREIGLPQEPDKCGFAAPGG